MPASCTTLSCDSVSLLITFAQLGQFVPQLWEMFSYKSTVGLSPFLLFFNSLYTLLAAIDIILLESHDALTCSNTAWRCFIDNQPLIQMIGSAVLCISMWYWFLKYHHHANEAGEEEQRLFNNIFYSPDAQSFYNSFLASAAIFCLLAVGLVLQAGIHSPMVVSYAKFCGILSAFLNAIMWVPQIIVTATYGHKGALAFGWIFASVVMDVTFSVYLDAMGSDWTVWANNVPDGIQTFILLVLILRLEYLDSLNKNQYEPLDQA